MIWKHSRESTPTTLEKVQSRPRRVDSRVSPVSLIPVLDMIRQTTELRASTLAKESMDIMFKNFTSSYIKQLSMKDEQITETTLITIMEKLGQTKKSFADVFCSKVFDIVPQRTGKNMRSSY